MRATVRSAAAPSSALELCGFPQRALLATQGRHGEEVRRQLYRRSDALLTQELMASMQPTISWARALSARDFVTEFSGGGTLDECGVAQSSSSELATQRHPSQPYSRLMMAMHVGGRLANSG